MNIEKFYTDPNLMSMPFCENPFFEGLLERRHELTLKQKQDLIFFHREGYLIIDLEVTEELLDNVIGDMKRLVDELPKQESGYHYNESPRLFEGWRHSKNILELSLNKKVLDTLRLLYGREPIPFQTINFFKGTEQPLHSDTIHFHTIPQKWVTACWIALEDMNEFNGPLKFVPESHKLPVYTFQDLNLKVPEYGKQFDNYKVYEEFIAAIAYDFHRQAEYFVGKKGQALIWASNLLHGGSFVANKSKTRLSQVTHYYFEGCEHYYCPLFSDPANGLISKKDLTNKKFI